MLFDGWQYLRKTPYNTPSIPIANRRNLISIEAWFKMNPLNPQASNTGWLFV
jgi:hypothetical protein